MDYMKESLAKHREWKGKLEVVSRAPVGCAEELSLAYTPGVAAPCLAIKDDPLEAYALTRKWNTVAVVTDGSAVLGLGNIGALAGMPVMEGKCALFKAFAGVDAVPVCLATQDTEEIIATVRNIAPSYGGINRHRAQHRALLRRHKPRGYLRAALLRDRAAAQGGT